MQRTEFCSEPTETDDERTEITIERTKSGIKTYKSHVQIKAILFMNAVPIYQQTNQIKHKIPTKKASAIAWQMLLPYCPRRAKSTNLNLSRRWRDSVY